MAPAVDPHDPTVGQAVGELPTKPLQAAALRPATRLGGRYLIVDELGRGGMGVVYAAYDAQLDRKVAVKQVLGTLGAAAELLALEGKALAKLQHPNVVAVHDIGAVDGEVFIAMELVDGEPLSRWARDRDPLDVLRAILDAGKGLAHAHHAGILHRDFKPGNVLVDKTGRARVADFGLAADTHSAERDASPVGTPGFMAPEIESGQPASVASDIYAYCRSLQRLVVERGGPAWLDPLVCRGLVEAPAERWSDLDTLIAAIERELAIDPEHDPRGGSRHRRTIYLSIASLVIAVPLVSLALVGPSPTLGIKEFFFTSLVPPIVLLVVLAVFRRAMMMTAYNRRRALTVLVVTIAIPVNNGFALALGTSTAGAACADLLVIAAFLFGAAIYDVTPRVYLGSASVCVAVAAAIVIAPSVAGPLFATVPVVLLPFVYVNWTANSRGHEPGVATGSVTVKHAPRPSARR